MLFCGGETMEKQRVIAFGLIILFSTSLIMAAEKPGDLTGKNASLRKTLRSAFFVASQI